MFTDIAVNLSVSGSTDAATDYALSVASTFGSHVSGVAYSYELIVPGVLFDGGVAATLIANQHAESERAAKAAAARFEEAARKAGVNFETRIVEATMAEAAEHMATVSRCVDLAIIGQPENDDVATEMIFEGVLFGAGRPVIVVPYIQEAGLKLDHITVCWDGGRAAARAVADAMPLLRKSKTIELLIVDNGERKTSELAGTDIAQHLARHGLSVDINRIVAPDIAAADAIMSRVADSSSDFLVMGGYGHSRLREFVLGGVTRSVIREMTLPTLMSH